MKGYQECNPVWQKIVEFLFLTIVVLIILSSPFCHPSPSPKPEIPPLLRNTFITNNDLYLKLHSGKMNDFGSRSEFQSSGIFCNFFVPQLESNNKHGCFYHYHWYCCHLLSTQLELGNVLGVQHADHSILSAQRTWEAGLLIFSVLPWLRDIESPVCCYATSQGERWWLWRALHKQ